MKNNMSRCTQQTKGFTLVEMVVYIGILALILAGVVNMVLAVGSTFGELHTARQLNRSARVALEVFVREVRDADSVNSGASVFDTNPSQVALIRPISGESPRIYVEGGTLKLDRGGTYVGDLTLPGVSVDSFVISSVPTSNPNALRLQMTLSSSAGKATKTETFYATAVTRGLYGQ